MEIFVVRIANPLDGHFIDLRIPSGSFETIARWFINDCNTFEIKIINRYACELDGSPLGSDINENDDFMSKYGICLSNGSKNGSNNL